ncbi:MAG TPA: radical SAM protein [Acidobacteriota bacterium]|nr:radical SAM protein [Acidobacteriota bacterium]
MKGETKIGVHTMLQSRHQTFSLNLLPHLLSWQQEDGVIVFDGEGRLYSLYRGNSLYRRGLDGSVLCTERTPVCGRLVRTHRRLEDPEALSLFALARQWASELKQKVRAADSPVFAGQSSEDLLARLDQVLAYTPEALLNERKSFSKLYQPVSVLPPDQYLSLVVQLTHGCPYNHCTFCDLYQDRSYRVKSPAELEQWLTALKRFVGRAIGMRKGIFLGDGNCLALPVRRLRPLIERVNSAFEGFAVLDKGLFSFADTRAIIRKSPQDLATLAHLGLKRVYLGLETGFQPLLAYLNKPGTREDQIESVRRLKESGLQVGVIFMIGVGGHRFAEEHVEQTIELIRSLPLTVGDLVYLSRFYAIPGTPYATEVLEGRIDLLTDEEINDQFNRIRTAVADSGVKVAPYDLAGFIY